MNDIDRIIRQSLSPEDAELLDRLDVGRTLHKQVLAMFEGELRWFNAAGWITGFLLFTVACVTAWRFLQASAVPDMLRWGAASVLSLAGVALVKVWFWLELQKNAVVREITWLEYQVVSLALQMRRR
jgi:hypothetical protein